jgi:catechol 1,2-dioxygenase
MENNTRRNFLKSTGMFAVAVSLAPTLLSCENPSQASVPDPCQTTNDILGPFFKANAPFQENIVPANSTATPLIIEGKVYSSCSSVLADAIVEIWNADENGDYDTTGFMYRGRYKTGADGSYTFTSIIPGKYLNGALYRPSHIHFKISAAGHKDLVSQIYFKDDTSISTDPWANSPKAKERILLVMQEPSGANMVNFDIHLEKA